MKHDEHYMQVAVIRQVDALCQMQRPDLLCCGVAPVKSSCNAAKRTPQQGAWMKAEGMRAGDPDLHCWHKDDEGRTLWIEMKTPKGRLTDNQFETLQRHELEGDKVMVCRTVESAVSEICKHLGIRVRR